MENKVSDDYKDSISYCFFICINARTKSCPYIVHSVCFIYNIKNFFSSWIYKSKNENNEEKTAEKEIEESVGMDETYKKYVESKDNILKTKDEPTIIYKEYIFPSSIFP